MFSQIKTRIQTVHQDLTDSIKNLAFGEHSEKPYRPSKQRSCDLDAGSELLQEYEILWEEIHENSEKNSKKADNVDLVITDICNVVDKQWNEMKELNYEVCMLPQLTNGIQELMIKIGEIEGVFEDVHSSLINLENIINEGKMQELKLEEHFHLALYKERKLTELESFKLQLDSQHKAKLREQEIKHCEMLKERQAIFKEAFEEEMQNYKTKGQLNTTIPSSSSHPSLDLADITIDEDQHVLDEFLADTNLDLDTCSNDVET